MSIRTVMVSQPYCHENTYLHQRLQHLRACLRRQQDVRPLGVEGATVLPDQPQVLQGLFDAGVLVELLLCGGEVHGLRDQRVIIRIGSAKLRNSEICLRWEGIG